MANVSFIRALRLRSARRTWRDREALPEGGTWAVCSMAPEFNRFPHWLSASSLTVRASSRGGPLHSETRHPAVEIWRRGALLGRRPVRALLLPGEDHREGGHAGAGAVGRVDGNRRGGGGVRGGYGAGVALLQRGGVARGG